MIRKMGALMKTTTQNLRYIHGNKSNKKTNQNEDTREKKQNQIENNLCNVEIERRQKRHCL